MSGATPAATDTEEWAEDDGFFTEFSNQVTGGLSTRKRNRQAQEQEQAALQSTIVEDEAMRKVHVEEARRTIAAAVIARASPREVRQAVKRAKNQKVGGQTTSDEKKLCVTAPHQKKKKARRD